MSDNESFEETFNTITGKEWQIIRKKSGAGAVDADVAKEDWFYAIYWILEKRTNPTSKWEDVLDLPFKTIMDTLGAEETDPKA